MSSTAYPEELISSTIAITLQSADQHPGIVGQKHSLGKGYSLRISGRLRQAQQTRWQARQHQEALQTFGQACAQIHQAQAWVERRGLGETRAGCARPLETAPCQPVTNYAPWRLVDATRQTSQEVESQLQAELQALDPWLETNGWR